MGVGVYGGCFGALSLILTFDPPRLALMVGGGAVCCGGAVRFSVPRFLPLGRVWVVPRCIGAGRGSLAKDGVNHGPSGISGISSSRYGL